MATRKPAAGKAAATKKAQAAEAHAKKQIWAIVLFALGLMLGALSFIEGDNFWLTLHDTFFGLFGFSALLIAPLFIYIAIMATLDKPIGAIGNKVWQIMIIVVLLSSAIQIFSYGPLKEKTFWACTVELFGKGVILEGGGLSSAIVALPLMALCGRTGAKIIIVLLLFVFIMIFTGGTLIGLLRGAAKPVKKMSETYIQRTQERQLDPPESPSFTLPPGAVSRPGTPARAGARFNVDIPLDGEAAAAAPPPKFAKRGKPPAAEPPKPKSSPFPDLPWEKPYEPPAAAQEPDAPIGEGAQGSFARQSLGSPVDTARDALFSAARNEGRFEFDLHLGDENGISTEQLPPEPDLVDISAMTKEAASEAGIAPAFTPDMAPAALEEEEETPSFPASEPFSLEDAAPGPDTLLHFRGVPGAMTPEVVQRPQTTDEVIDEILRRSAHSPARSHPSAAAPDEALQKLESGIDDVMREAGLDPSPSVKPAEGFPVFRTENPPAASRGELLQEEVPTPPTAMADTAQAAPEAVGVGAAPSPAAAPAGYPFPPVTLLKEPAARVQDESAEELKQNAQRLVDTLQSFGVQTRIIDIAKGPAVTRYELQPSAGVKISKITSLADDIALNLAAAGVRIEAPIPNKPAVGIEVPNRNISMVNIREIVDSPEFTSAKSPLTMALGRDISGRVTVADIGKMPHMLIAGATGSGKSVCINSIIMSLLYKSPPDKVKLLMVDPKVVELGIYNGIPHLLVPVVTDPKKAAGALAWAVNEMLGRYKQFADNSVRDISGFNRLCQSRDDLIPMPHVVIIIDELADLMMAAPNEVEDYICRLAQMARAAGMHLIIATQRPSVDVITGVIKANIPSRIAFAVSSSVDSRTILDSGGAEKLLGRGDMLFYPVGTAKPLRVQGCFVSDQEVERVVDFIKQGPTEQEYDEAIMQEIERQAVTDKKKGGGSDNDGGGFDDEDEMLPAAIECVVEMGMASTSMLQRKLKLGYARAARIVDQLEEKGVVGPYEGSKPRQVLISREQYYEMKMNQAQ